MYASAKVAVASPYLTSGSSTSHDDELTLDADNTPDMFHAAIGHLFDLIGDDMSQSSILPAGSARVYCMLDTCTQLGPCAIMWLLILGQFILYGTLPL